jgi:hypothetical protein
MVFGFLPQCNTQAKGIFSEEKMALDLFSMLLEQKHQAITIQEL